MMVNLYQYRVQKTRETFAEFTQTIKDGKPEMQLKEIINFNKLNSYLNSIIFMVL